MKEKENYTLCKFNLILKVENNAYYNFYVKKNIGMYKASSWSGKYVEFEFFKVAWLVSVFSGYWD